jgi:proteic killer suppression protein
VKIIVSAKAKKQLKKVPEFIRTKFDYWCDLITDIGLRESRKYKGFHDEPLKGERRGQRSVRLSKAYRAIYVEIKRGEYEIVEVIEVNKHEY